MEINTLLNSLRRLECKHINLVCNLAKENKALAACMLNIPIDMMDKLEKIDPLEINQKLMSVFEINRRSLFTLEKPLTLPDNMVVMHEAHDNEIVGRIKSNERKIIVTMRELMQMDTDIGMVICRLNYQSAIELCNTPADMVEESVYASRNSGLLKLMVKDITGLYEFINTKRLSHAGLRYDRLVG